MSKEKWKKVWTGVGIIIFLIVLYILSKHTDFIQQILYRSGRWALVVALILYPILAPTPITSDPITLTLAVIYGPVTGAVISFVGNMIASIIEYFTGYKIGQATNFEKTKDKIPLGLGKLPVNSVPFLVFGRMIPGYGGKVISLMAGTYKVPLGRFWWTTTVTNLAGSILFSYGGWGLVKAVKISGVLHQLGI